MADPSTEVNDLLVRLSAAAHNVRGPECTELMYLISRLSNAVTRERAAGMTELQGLRLRLLQRPSSGNNSGRPPNKPAMPAFTRQTAMVPASGVFSQDRLNAVLSGTPLSPTRQSKPDPALGPQRTASNTMPLGPRGRKRSGESMTEHLKQYDHLHQNVTGTGPQQLKRESSASAEHGPLPKKLKALPTAPIKQAQQKGHIVYYGLACHVCIVSGGRCREGTGRRCTRCQPDPASHGQCVFVKCPDPTCSLPNCPLVHPGQHTTQPGRPEALVLDVNIQRRALTGRELASIKQALHKVAGANFAAKRQKNLQASLQQSQDAMQTGSVLATGSMTAASTAQYGGVQPPTSATFSPQQHPHKVLPLAQEAVAETRDPRLIAKARSRPNERHSDPGNTARPAQSHTEQPARLAELTHARITGFPLRKAATAVLSQQPGSDAGDRRVVRYVDSPRLVQNQPGPTLVEQQRSVEELLQSLAPFGANYEASVRARPAGVASPGERTAQVSEVAWQPATSTTTAFDVTIVAAATAPGPILDTDGLASTATDSQVCTGSGVVAQTGPLGVGELRTGLAAGEDLGADEIEEGEVVEVKVEEQIKPEPTFKMEAVE